MKKRQMITVTQVVSIWRMIYMEQRTFKYVAEKLGLIEGSCYGAYKTITAICAATLMAKSFMSIKTP